MTSLVSGLRVRLLLAILLVFAPVFGLALATGLEQRAIAAAEAEAEALRLARLAAANHEAQTDDARQLLATLALLPEARSRDSAACSALFADLVKQRPGYVNLGVAGLDGNVFCQGLPVGTPLNVADRGYFREAIETGGFTFSDFEIGRLTGKPVVLFGYPVVDQAGRPEAVVIASLDLGWLNQMAGQMRLPAGTTLTIVDRNGTIIARYPDPERWVGQRAAELPIVKAILASRGEGTVEASGLDEVRRLYAFARLDDAARAGGGYLTVGIPVEVAFAKADWALLRNLAGLGVVTLVALVAAWIGGDLLILRWVNVLVRATKRLAAGDLDIRSGPPYGAGELSELARAFDQMAAALQTRHAEAERAEDALARLGRQNELILDSLGEGVYGLDRSGRATFVNPAGARMVGYEVDELIGEVLHEIVHQSRPDGTPYPLAACPSYRTCRDGQARHAADELFWRKDGTSFPVELVSTPILEQGQVVGAVVTFRDITERKHTETALQRANEELAGWVKELEQRSREIVLLSQMGDLLQTCLTAEEAYTVIAGAAQKLFPTESGAVYVLGAAGRILEAAAIWGDSPPVERVFGPEDCWALRRGRLHLVEGADHELTCRHLRDSQATGYLCLPMMAHGEALGVLHLQAGRRQADGSDGRLTESQRQLAATVGEHIALALANLRLQETLRSQAIRDPLTGLLNRRYMEESLEREVRRAVRRGTPIGIVMFDIDHFKEFNDQFGHAAGDAVLRELGAFLRTHVRGEDIACRYGGEEFTVILTEASLEVARQRAEQLRAGVKAIQVLYQGLVLGPVTMSFGVAAFPEHGATGEDLLQAADAALYRAKREGRDLVRIAV